MSTFLQIHRFQPAKRRHPRVFVRIVFVLWILQLLFADLLHAATVGIPPIRFYAIEDIGNVSPGFRLGFDPLGRVSVTYYNEYLVLNDDKWIRLTEDGDAMEYALVRVGFAEDNTAYFTSHGHWGVLKPNAQGKLSPVSLSPAQRPEWTLASEFDKILFVEGGVIFYNWNGMVYLDRTTGQQKFLQIRGLEQVLNYKGEIYVTIVSVGIRKVDLKDLRLEMGEVEPYAPAALKKGVLVASDSILFSHPGRGFLVYNGRTIKEWATELDALKTRNIVDFCYLSEGNLAVALDGEGVFVLSQKGEILLALTSDEFQRVKEISTNEPGIFWFSTDSGVGKVHYGGGIMSIGKRSGFQVGWPQVYNWKDGHLIVSDSRIYESVKDEATGVVQFQLVTGQPDKLNLTAVADGDFLLIGNGDGIVRGKDEVFTPVLQGIDVARIVKIREGTCLIIGTYEITAIRFDGEKWVECGDRIPGFGFPSVVHQVGETVWIELGLDRAVRIRMEHCNIKITRFEDYPWEEPAWVNLGFVGNRVIMSGRGSKRVYFDETTETVCEAPDLDALFAQSPFTVSRVVEDIAGNIWISHNHGVSIFLKTPDGYRFDLGASGIIKEPSPIFEVIEDGTIWVAARNSLYCVDPGHLSDYHPDIRPQLDTVRDVRTGKTLSFNRETYDLGTLNYESNNLSFRFFSGTYLLPTLDYRVEVKNKHSEWSLSDTDSSFTIPNLKEGSYQLKVELMDSGIPVGQPLTVLFSIRPPWYRSTAAFAFYFFGLVVVSSLMASVPVLFIRNRNKMLSRLVEERTHKLQETMEKLALEERNSAVHEERNRIANEIHDSVQQGLSGLKLILDSLLKFDHVSDEVRSRLKKAKTILAFTHQEVHHAVWDMEATVLEEGNLRVALEKIAELLDSRSRHIRVVELGNPSRLPAATNHHLLRIVQESITNAINHGDAANIIITLDYHTEDLVMTIADDGTGFDVDKATKNTHQLGLRGVLSRVDRFRGKVDIYSEIDKGTTITITIPLNPNN